MSRHVDIDYLNMVRERSLWPDRPHPGDTITTKTGRGPLTWLGRVVETFYQNGEGGMHVLWTDLATGQTWGSWSCCHNVDVVERAKEDP